MTGQRNLTTGTLWGRLLSVVALVFCVPVGLYFASIAVGSVGLLLGVTGYGLGARRLGVVAVVACTVAMLLGYYINREAGR